MNLPNKLTIFRIILVIPFSLTLCFLLNEIKPEKNILLSIDYNTGILFLISGGIFGLAMITDFIDGCIARKRKQETSFGKLFDPLADKIITTTALVFFSILGIVPIYITIIFIVRDLIVDGTRKIAVKNNVSFSAGKIGKLKTMIMSLSIIIIFISLPFLNPELDLINPSWEIWVLISPLLLSSILSIISGIQYFNAIKKYISYK